METLKDIAKKKEEVQLQRDRRARAKELTKYERAITKLKKAAQKDVRDATKLSKRKFNDAWTKDAIEEAKERLQIHKKRKSNFRSSSLLG